MCEVLRSLTSARPSTCRCQQVGFERRAATRGTSVQPPRARVAKACRPRRSSDGLRMVANRAANGFGLSPRRPRCPCSDASSQSQSPSGSSVSAACLRHRAIIGTDRMSPDNAARPMKRQDQPIRCRPAELRRALPMAFSFAAPLACSCNTRTASEPQGRGPDRCAGWARGQSDVVRDDPVGRRR